MRKRWLREPLLHFLLAGRALFVVYQAFNPAAAHRDASSRITLTEEDFRQMTIAWQAQGRPRIPVPSGMRLPVVLQFPDDVRNVTEPATHELSDSLVERRVIAAGGDGLAGKCVELAGLQATITYFDTSGRMT